MPIVHIIVLALIQGLTEFLPVSSAAHLIIGGRVMGWPDQGLVFDLSTHVGTLLAALVYFRRELMAMAVAVIRPRDSAEANADRTLAGWLIVATLPALIGGFLMHDLVEHLLRDLRVIAVNTLVFGAVMWWADVAGARTRQIGDLGWRGAILVGLAQAMALVPGVSRSGITITAGRFLGLTPEAAARFSFLLSIPITAAVGAYGALRVATGQAEIDWFDFGLAVAFSALAGYACIAAFLALMRRVGLLPFVLYRLALGLVLAWFVF